MKNFLTFLTVLGSFYCHAQQNEVSQIGLKKIDPFVFIEYGKNYYFNTSVVGINTLPQGSNNPISVTLNKVDKVTHQIVRSILLMGDTIQRDSIISPFTQFSCRSGNKLFFFFERNYKFVSKHVPQKWQTISVIGVDTNLNIVLPETCLKVVSFPASSLFFGCNLQSICSIGSQIIVGYTQSDTLGFGTALSRYIIVDHFGSIKKEGLVGLDPYQFQSTSFSTHQLSEIVARSDGKILIAGQGLIGFATANATILADSNMTVIDTFATKENRTITGAFTIIPNFLSLPTGSLVCGGGYVSTSISGDYSAIGKLSAKSRYSYDTVVEFLGLHGRQDNHNRFPSLHSLEYNKIDNSIYYAFADKTPQIYGASCQDTLNYVEIVSVDTNMRTRWRKWISPANHSCAAVSRVVSSNQRSGIDVIGIYRDAVSTKDTSLQGSFIYHIDSAGALEVVNQSNFNVRDRFRIYPNPSSNIVTIDDILNRIVAVSVFDIQGRQIYASKVSSPIVQVSLAEYPSGPYLIMLILNDGTRYSKQITHN